MQSMLLRPPAYEKRICSFRELGNVMTSAHTEAS
ncbi:hypothetical protein D918_08258 [Trichuris suis]|nr:hypothetical protein D918_08258 [Trichuris suis]